MLKNSRLGWLALGATVAGLLALPLLIRGRSASAAQSSPPAAAPNLEALRLNNLGVAYMEQQRPEDALKAFEQAYAADPKNYVPRLNQGIALLNLQRGDDARKILTEICQTQAQDPRGWYNLGLLEKSAGNVEASIAAFEHADLIDPGETDTHYFLGLLYSELHKYPRAIQEFTIAIKLNSYHVSAEFGLAQAYQRSGDEANAKKHLERFQHLNADKLGAPMSLIYGEQGKYSLAEQISAELLPVPPAIAVHFEELTGRAGLPTKPGARSGAANANDTMEAFGSGVCVFDYNGDGLPDIFLVNANGDGRAALFRNDGKGKFTDVTKAAGLDIHERGFGCAAGDYDNDGHTDLAVSFNGHVTLYHNEGNGKFRDATNAAGIHVTGLALGLNFFDFDHDGDLDLYVTCYPPATAAKTETADAEEEKESVPGGGNMLWRNNGNGTFTEWTGPTGLAAPPGGIAALASDTNNDRAIDLFVTGPRTKPAGFLNQREGKFEKYDDPWWGFVATPTAGIVALDFDKDGWMDIALTHWSEPGITLWKNIDGRHFERKKLPDLGWKRAWGIAALDYDNDGWVDLVAVGEDASGGKIALLRNEGPAGFKDVTKDTGLDKVHLMNPRSVVALDYDRDGGIDLLITQLDAPPVLLRNVGGNKNNWLELSLKGLNDNKSAIGTEVEVFSGALRQKFEVSGASGYLGQGPMEVHVGLGTESEADVVRLLWPTGVVQDEVHVAADATRSIAEIDRRGSSCPIVFVWNGSRYEFLADMIGPGIVGHWIAPGQRDVPDPDEYFKVSGSQVAMRDGQISFRMIEPMEELDYLDQVRLLAVDHPSDVEVYPNEYFASNPPFPKFKVIASRNAHALAGAWDDRGHNVLPLLLQRDRKYVMDFAGAPYQGFAATHSLTLDLGEWDASRPLRLLMDGFTDYFTANSMYAAWQAGIRPMAPYVEAQDSSGKWVRVMDDMGFPAGLARTMVADLTGKVPAGTRRIRIVTNLKIYWDRIRVDNSLPDIAYRLNEVPLADANLAFRGYPQVVEGEPKNDIYYVYENVSPTGPYSRQAGNYTRYGDVKELVTKSDNKYVICGSGDEVAVNFDPSHLPPVPAGWTRDYFFYADGFAKDMDFYAAHGDTVDPLPFHTLVPYPYPNGTVYPMDAEHLRYILEYNTRGVNGPAGSSYQFHYPQ
ncbi:MAG: FG-GAP-like repeat-containing protein [Candidatus Acidiferrales bacterium]